MTLGADIFPQELFHPLHALVILDLCKSIFYSVDGIVIGKVQLAGLIRVLGVVEDMLFLCWTVVDDVLFLFGQVAERHIRPHAHLPADVCHQRPHQAVPRGHCAAVDGQRVVRHQRRHVHRPDAACAAALLAGPLRVESQLLRRRRIEMRTALRADQLLARRNSQRRRDVMPVRAAVACEAGVHEPQAVQQFRAGAEGAADARHARPLVQRQRRRDIQHLFHRGFRSLGHPAAGVGGQRLQIPAGAFGIQHPQRQRGFTRPRHARNAHDLVQRDVHVDVFQVVYLCPAHEHFVYHSGFPSLWLFCAR